MAKKNQKTNERRAMVEQMRSEQARKERTRSLLILGACIIVVGALIGSAAFVAIKDSRDKDALAKKKLASIGKTESAAGCDPIKTTKTDGQQNHIPDGTPITYNDAPPSFGNHRPSPTAFGRPFYSADRPEVAALVHNLEHGYVIAWYDETAAKDDKQMDQLKAIAEKFQNAQGRFIAVPWYTKEHDGLPADGKAFPDGKHIALTRWSADAENPGDTSKQAGNWQYCTSVSGGVMDAFFNKYTNEQSPEPGQPLV
ncbi:hypothetical protein ABIE44_002935 [Marmoricola sp. OAE513]|uniref:DUF3105 domain-containing protein n=1 Tax=Marmoricola sp. OAE513 TaxID=2817894 RepID=UPI001AE8D67D